MNEQSIPENEFQYWNTKMWYHEFMLAACKAKKVLWSNGGNDPLSNKLNYDAAASMAESLKDQYERYEALHPEIKEAEKVG